MSPATLGPTSEATSSVFTETFCNFARAPNLEALRPEMFVTAAAPQRGWPIVDSSSESTAMNVANGKTPQPSAKETWGKARHRREARFPGNIDALHNCPNSRRSSSMSALWRAWKDATPATPPGLDSRISSSHSGKRIHLLSSASRVSPAPLGKARHSSACRTSAAGGERQI